MLTMNAIGKFNEQVNLMEQMSKLNSTMLAVVTKLTGIDLDSLGDDE